MSTVITAIRDIQDRIVDRSHVPSGWACKVITWDDNLSYLAWNEKTREAILVDTCREDIAPLRELLQTMPDLRVIAVIDTHTHADHVSAGAEWSEMLQVPWIMHAQSPTRRAQIRIYKDAPWITQAGAIRFMTTPGHTPDCVTPLWGPFLFAGDIILYGDTGRDDLPGGDPVAHYESLQKIRAAVTPETLVLPGHDAEGGRIASWKTQLEINPSLTQNREDFIREAGAYVGPSPKLLKESLFENFK